MSRGLTYLAVALSAWVLGLAWAVSSPIGSSPDDNFHLASIWCATGSDSSCRVIDDEPPDLLAEVPTQVLMSGCFAFYKDLSAACVDVPDDQFSNTDWFNYGLYPPVFYKAMSVFVGPDIWRSVLVMRMAALTGVLVLFGLAAWVSPLLRDSHLIAVAAGSLPLGMFVFASTNPSSWATAGVVAMWPAAHALATAPNWRTRSQALSVMALAAVFACSRGDTAAMAAVVAGATLVMFATRPLRWQSLLTSLPVMALLAAAFITSGQTDSLQSGLTNESTATGTGLLWANILEVPTIWAGAFGVTFGLGWFDTPMPASTWFPAFGIAAFLTMFGLSRIGIRRGLVLLAMVGMAITLPLLILQRSGSRVGEDVQPRYLLPVVIATMCVALAPLDGRWRLGRAQHVVLAVTATLGTAFAVHVQLRRYVTGLDEVGADLNSGAEWMPAFPLGPNGVWLLATVAAAVLFTAVFGLGVEPAEPETRDIEGREPSEARPG